MRFEIENSVIKSYKRLSYDPWYAFAEFVDNSTQAYFDNKTTLDAIFAKNGESLTVVINYDPGKDVIEITDNSIGMNEDDLDKAFKVGRPPENPTGRSKYGLGMKTAACWFGDNWTVKTKKLYEAEALEVSIDVDVIAKTEGEFDLNINKFESTKQEHYTKITITNLNRKFAGRTLGKIREFLGSMYRFDFSSYGLKLYWNGGLVEWQSFENRLYIQPDGTKFKKTFEFTVNDKTVKGWVGVLGKGYGSRKNAGFSIIQNNRVIQGWPDSYKPASVFGEQEDGSNDLVNQRVVGELFLDNFSVSHTKDKIVWEDDEENQVDKKLGEMCAEARELALKLRFTGETQKKDIEKIKDEAITLFSSELKSNEVYNFLKTVQPYPEKIIASSYNASKTRIQEEEEASIIVKVGSESDSIDVMVFFNEKSEFEPYVLTETTLKENRIFVIINILHPHIQQMNNSDTLINFIRHCVYDGVAEWKAFNLRGDIQPYTIKFLKDGLLRIPYEIKLKQNN